jgi:hypothetical protein
MNEDFAALLQSSSAGSKVVGNGGLLGLPTARVSAMATKRRRERLWGSSPYLYDAKRSTS